jgi:5-methylcytosine-specific restriction protein B
MYTKELSDPDLGIGSGNQTHIGLHEDMVRGWSAKDRTYDAFLFLGESDPPIACQAVINGITAPNGTVRSPKIKTGSGIPDEKNLLKLIRKYGNASRRWLTIAQLPNDILLVFLGKRPTTADSVAEEARVVSGDELGNELQDIVKKFAKYSADCGLRFDLPAIHRFIAALLSKRFLLLTGLAGSGKTKIAQAFARWIAETTNDYAIVPVGADWTGNENILGYPDGLDSANYVLKPALELILKAGNSKTPHFLILDEMNLSHVERYFADILSAIESGEKVPLYKGSPRMADGRTIPSDLELPDNLFVIGTVNVDETTYMFSPKVLDRANAIEFRTDASELLRVLNKPKRPELTALTGKGCPDFAEKFVEATRSSPSLPKEQQLIFNNEMLLFFTALKSHGSEFGYRMALDASRLFYFHQLIGDGFEDEESYKKAFDSVVSQKILPKLHGSRAKLGPLLKTLWYLCVNQHSFIEKDDAKLQQLIRDAISSAEKSTSEPSIEASSSAAFPVSADKIARMWRLLKDNGFASFAEA